MVIGAEQKTFIDTYEIKKKEITKFNLTSDLFAAKVFEDIMACQELCRILLQDDNILLNSVTTQYVIRSLTNHSVELDIFAVEKNGSFINIEIQMYPEMEPFKRTRYYMASIDMNILDKGQSYNELPNVTVLYITQKDFIGGHNGSYEINRNINLTNAAIDADNGLHEKYFNLEYPTDDERINELLNYFQHSDPFYHTKYFPRIVERVNYFKEQKEGVTIMCEIADRIRKEGKLESKIEDVLALLAELGQIPQQIVQRIYQETNLEILSKWLKNAAKASSISEFEMNM